MTDGLLGWASLPGMATSVPRARAYVGRVLTEAGYSGLTENATLLVSELVTNAVMHTDSGKRPCGRIVVAVSRTNSAVRVDVGDDGALTRPAVLRDSDGENGRGLLFVDTLAERWGCVDGLSGRAVWFELKSQ
jgi:serine/threonine-protein kinase RsbW